MQEIVITVMGIKWTYTLTNESFKVKGGLYNREVPWSQVTGVALGENPSNPLMPHNLLIAYRPPGARSNKMLTMNIGLHGDMATQQLLGALQSGMPHLWRGSAPLLEARKLMGVSNTWVYASVGGILAAFVVAGIVFAVLDQ